MADINVLVLLGSLRAASVNRQLAELAVENAPDGVSLQLFDRLGELPFYNEDIDNEDVAESVTALREAAADADAALVVTPEYNGSIPGVLKNAIDWLSRPYGDSALKDKPLAVVGAALGQYGGVVGARRDPQIVRYRRAAGGRGSEVVGADDRSTGSIRGRMPRSPRTCAMSSASWPQRSPDSSHFSSRRAGSIVTRRRLCCCRTATGRRVGLSVSGDRPVVDRDTPRM